MTISRSNSSNATPRPVPLQRKLLPVYLLDVLLILIYFALLMKKYTQFLWSSFVGQHFNDNEQTSRKCI